MGPRATPPPTQIGERDEPARARPVPFWRNGLVPPPRTSARVLVDWVPERAAASWAVTTWWSTAWLGSMPNSDGSRSTGPSSAPSIERRVTVRRCGAGRRKRRTSEGEAVSRSMVVASVALMMPSLP